MMNMVLLRVTLVHTDHHLNAHTHTSKHIYSVFAEHRNTQTLLDWECYSVIS